MLVRIVIVAGTRPEAIKVAPLVLALRSAGHDVVLASTGQHREMLAQVLDAFNLGADEDLGLQNHGLSLAELAAETLRLVDGLVLRRRPDALVVQGDTSAAFAGALAGFYRQVPVVHLEAGLRTGDLAHPWPEEANRQLVGRLAALHLAPSAAAVANLVAERVGGSVVHTGNTGIDALLLVRAAGLPWQTPALHDLDLGSDLDLGLDLDPGGSGRIDVDSPRGGGGSGPFGGELRAPLLLVTLHRRESWATGIAEVAAAVASLAVAYPHARIVFPVHRNPVVRRAVEPALAGLANVLLLAPLPYPDMVRLLDRSTFVITDSGGLQEEAPALGKPVLVCRDTTERPEAVAAGVAKLVGTTAATIEAEARRLLDDPAAYAAMATGHNPYGDGRAAQRCVTAIEALA